MRYMVIVRSDETVDVKMDPAIFEKMAKFNEELAAAGVMLSGEGLQPSAKGALITFKGKERKVVDGPFAEAKELVGGFWIWQVKSREEALEWVKKIPFEDGTVELRKVSEPEDFLEIAGKDIVEREKKLAEKLKEQQKQSGKKK